MLVGLSSSGLESSRGSLLHKKGQMGASVLRAEEPRVLIVEDYSRGPVRYSQRCRMAV